jgi:hypothetical protein
MHKFQGMLSLFYVIKVAQNGGQRLHCMLYTAWLCYAELFEWFPAFPRWFQLLLKILPQDYVVSIGVLYTSLCIYPQRKKFNGIKSGERGGQVIGPACPMHLLPKVSPKYSQRTLVKCQGLYHTTSGTLALVNKQLILWMQHLLLLQEFYGLLAYRRPPSHFRASGV